MIEVLGTVWKSSSSNFSKDNGLVLLVIFQLVSAGFGLFLSHIILFNQPKSAEILPAEHSQSLITSRYLRARWSFFPKCKRLGGEFESC
jgi:hypothetical protein